MTFTAAALRVDGRTRPIGIGTVRPEFTWRPTVTDGARGIIQAAYQLVLEWNGRTVWDSDRVASEQPMAVYSGPALEQGADYSWRVRLWERGHPDPGPWSETSTFGTGVLDERTWQAQWITAAPGTIDEEAALYLRGSIELTSPVVRARAHVSSLGWNRVFVNGRDLTGDRLVPRFTPYEHTVEYQTYDVTDAFADGANVVGLVVGDGRFRGRLGMIAQRAVYGSQLAGFAQFELELADGTHVTWVTDERWGAASGAITSSDPKFGERVDLRLEADWLSPAAPLDRFSPAVALPPHPRALIAEEVEPVGRIAELQPVALWRAPSGKQVIDFGQNFAGVVRLRLRGEAGQEVVLTHSELATADGELDAEWILHSKKHPWYQRDRVILDGADRWWQPWFTIHGFRYVEVDGMDRDLEPDDIRGVVLSTQVDATASFRSSDPRLDRLFQNALWSARSNFTDTATDCPTRERSGWTGDLQAFGPTAITLLDSRAFLRRYLRNLAIEQLDDGRVLPYVPSELGPATAGWVRGFERIVSSATGWGDVSVQLPWELYLRTADVSVLERQYASGCAWVRQMERRARLKSGLARRFQRGRVGKHERYVLDSGWQWGEWMRPGQPLPALLTDGVRKGAVVSTAYFARSAAILSSIAEVLGREDDARRHRTLAERVTEAWRAAFVHPDGTIGTDRQDDYVRALAFELLPAQARPAAANRLVELLRAADYHLATGFLSTPMLLRELVDAGHADVAMRVLLKDSPPSWLYQVERGATTTWETWEGYNAEGRGAGSHNHYAFGAVASFLLEGVLGIRATSPGYRTFAVRPVTGGGLQHAEGATRTPYGDIRVSWRHRGESVELTVDVPPGTEAHIELENESMTVGSGEHIVDVARIAIDSR